MQKPASPKKKLTKTIIITLIFLLAPLTAFASASPTYMAGIENVCDLSLTDSQGDVYDEQDIEDFGQGNYGHHTRIIVEPSTYTMNINCVSNINNGEISVDVISVLDQDGINNFNPSADWNTIQSSTFFVSSAAGSLTLDATGTLTNQLLVKWEIDAEANNGDIIELEGLIIVLPMVDTTNDTTPRISMWPGKVNQHNENGVWMTDSDGVSGGWSSASYSSDYGDRKLEYCQKFWPNTDSVELRPFKEEIDFWTRGNTDSYTSIRDVYECVLGDDLGDNNSGGDNDTGDNVTEPYDPCNCSGEITSLRITESSTFDHYLFGRVVSLQDGSDYDLSWTITDEDDTILYSGIKSWTAEHSSSSMVEYGLDIPNGEICAEAKLYQDGVLVDERISCHTIGCEENPDLPGDDNTGGDDDTGGDDNNTGGDDDTGGDDNNTGGDDDTSDDNNTGGDNDTGDDNNTGGDDDTGGDDNNTGGDNDTGDEDEQPYIPPTLEVELDTTTSPSLLSLTASNLDSSKDYTIEWMIVSTDTYDIISGSEGIENSTGLQITDTWLVTDEMDLESGEYCLLGTLFEDGELIETEVMDCQTVVTPEVVEDNEVKTNMVEQIVTAITEMISGLLASIVESKDE